MSGHRAARRRLEAGVGHQRARERLLQLPLPVLLDELGLAEGDIPGTLIANTVIVQPGQEDINVQAQFINQGGQWQLQKAFACALITNAGLEPPATCAAALPHLSAPSARTDSEA